MATQVNIVSSYAKADSKGKVDIIIRHYPNFMGIVESYTDGLRYMIETERAFNRRANHGELGVRVKTSGGNSNITADTAISRTTTREAIVKCDFSGGVLEGVDRKEQYEQDAYVLKEMREHYELFNQQLVGLEQEEAEVFNWFLKREKDLTAIAEDKGIVYESAQKRIQKVKTKIKIKMTGFMDGNTGGITNA